MLVEQLHRYNTIFWQFPLALGAANLVAIQAYVRTPPLMLVLALISAPLIYALYKMYRTQDAIIRATRKAEEELRKHAPDFIPEFSPRWASAMPVVVVVLAILDIALLLYGVGIIPPVDP